MIHSLRVAGFGPSLMANLKNSYLQNWNKVESVRYGQSFHVGVHKAFEVFVRAQDVEAELGSISSTCLCAAFTHKNVLALNFYFTNNTTPNFTSALN